MQFPQSIRGLSKVRTATAGTSRLLTQGETLETIDHVMADTQSGRDVYAMLKLSEKMHVSFDQMAYFRATHRSDSWNQCQVTQAGVPTRIRESITIGTRTTTARGKRYLSVDDFNRQIAAGLLEVDDLAVRSLTR